MQSAVSPRLAAFPVSMFIAGFSVIMTVIGALGPWARVPGYKNVYGLVGGDTDVFWIRGTEAPGMIPLVGDGMIALILALIAGGLIIWRLVWPPRSSGFILLAIFGLLAVAALIGMVNWANTSDIPRADSSSFFSSSVEASWGLIVLCLGVWPGILASAYQLWRDELR